MAYTVQAFLWDILDHDIHLWNQVHIFLQCKQNFTYAAGLQGQTASDMHSDIALIILHSENIIIIWNNSL